MFVHACSWDVPRTFTCVVGYGWENSLFVTCAFSASTLFRKGIWPAKKTDLWGSGIVICLERGADLHMAQLMPLPLTISCSSKIQMVLPFWYRLTWVLPDEGPLNACVLLSILTSALSVTKWLRTYPWVLACVTENCMKWFCSRRWAASVPPSWVRRMSRNGFRVACATKATTCSSFPYWSRRRPSSTHSPANRGRSGGSYVVHVANLWKQFCSVDGWWRSAEGLMVGLVVISYHIRKL